MNDAEPVAQVFWLTRRAIEDWFVLLALELGDRFVECLAVNGIGRPRGKSGPTYGLDAGDTHSSGLPAV